VQAEGIKFRSVKIVTLWNLILFFSRYCIKMFVPFGTVYDVGGEQLEGGAEQEDQPPHRPDQQR
jgi:hypothetical protein